ncbi:MAG: AAA family ATPase [Bacteroidota bacterium]
MGTSLAERLAQAQRAQFVGRVSELHLFETALRSDPLPFAVLHVYGPAGIGKSTLLEAFRRTCTQHDVPVWSVSLGGVPAEPQAVLGRIAESVGANPSDVLGQLAEVSGRSVLILDEFDSVQPLEGWFRSTFLPCVSADLLVVLASRSELSASWRLHAAWRSLLQSMALRNLSEAESRAFLDDMDVAPALQRRVFEATYGHPLALTLAAEFCRQRGTFDESLVGQPDLIKTLLDRFVMEVPSPAHRTALEASSLLRSVSQSLLADMLDTPNVSELFEWLRSRPFVEATPRGLELHALARDVISAELRWRNPDWYAELKRRARRHFNRALQASDTASHRSILTAYAFLDRDNPVLQPFLSRLLETWAGAGALYLDDGHEDDLPALTEATRRHHGPEDAEWLSFWAKRQPEGLRVVRAGTGEPVAFVLSVLLGPEAAHSSLNDPCVSAAYASLKAPLRSGERLLVFRVWMSVDDHQSISASQSLLFVDTVRQYLSTERLAVSALPCMDGTFWKPALTFAGLELASDSPVLDGQPFSLFVHDWREQPPEAWLEGLANRGQLLASTPQPEPEKPRMVVLDRTEFDEAVKSALAALHRPDRLAGNPLLASRLVLERAADEPSETLRLLIEEAAGTMREDGKRAKYYAAVDRTYLRPAPSQEIAAELVGVPYSTFRRHLKAGLSVISDVLWTMELGG